MAIGVYEQEKIECFIQVSIVSPSTAKNINFTLPETEGLYYTGCLINEDNKMVEVKSIVDALNFVSSKGWEYVSQYTEEDHGITLYRFVFKKKVSLYRMSIKNFHFILI